MNGIQRNLTGGKISTCFSGRSENKVAILASDWLRHFRLLLWNRWTEFNETWQEARSQRLLPSPGLWVAETFSTSLLKPMNKIQRNSTWSNISTSSTKFVFVGPIGKIIWPPWPLNGWDIFDVLSKPLIRIQQTTERNSTKLDSKQDLNLFSGPIGKTRWPPWPLIGWDIFDFSSQTAEHYSTKPLYGIHRNLTGSKFSGRSKNKEAAPRWPLMGWHFLLLWNRCMELKEIWQEARSQRPLPSLCFSGRSEKQEGHSGLWLARLAIFDLF